MINLIILLLILVFVIYWGFCIYHITKSKFKNQNLKVLWIVLIYAIPLSSIFYFHFNKKMLIK